MIYKCSYCLKHFNFPKHIDNGTDDVAVCPFCGHDDFEKTQEDDEE